MLYRPESRRGRMRGLCMTRVLAGCIMWSERAARGSPFGRVVQTMASIRAKSGGVGA